MSATLEAAPSVAAALLTPLPSEFYAAPVLRVARAMIGKLLVHRSAQGLSAGRIVETEAYRGPEDLASHSAGGRRTRRTEVMFGPAGRVYMFRLYGMHWAFNVVAGRVGDPHAVLVRAIEPCCGVELMAVRRGLAEGDRRLANGPGKLCKALALDGAAYGLDLCNSCVFLAEGIAPRRVCRTTRIGVDYSGTWAKKPWRFYEPGNPYISVRPRA